ncbi:MAG: hypothetical protein ABIR27_01250 [Dokdonella sp.]
MNSVKTRRELRGCFFAALVYLATTWVWVWLLRHPLVEAGLAVRAAVSLIPMIPIGFAVGAVLRLVRAGDELERRIDLEALAIAAVAVGMAALTLNVLMDAQVIEISAHLATVWIFPTLLLTYAVTKIWARSRYQ